MNRRISLSLPESHVEKLDLGRGELDLSRSAFARLLLDFYSEVAGRTNTIVQPSSTNKEDPKFVENYLRKLRAVKEEYNRDPEFYNRFFKELRKKMREKGLEGWEDPDERDIP